MGEESEIVTLSRISLKLKNGEITLSEDTFSAEAKDIIFKIKDPEKLPGYRLKYVMKNKMSKVTARPQDKSDPTAFDCYAIYLEAEERVPLLKLLTEDIENKLKEFQNQVNNSLINMVKFRRESIPSE